MRSFALALLAAATLLACSRSRPALVVEEPTPIVGPDGKTTEAVGVASQYGEFVELIPQGATVPCSKAQVFATSHRHADRVEFAVFRGTAGDTRDDHPLGVYGAPKPRNEKGKFVPIEVTFAIGADRKLTLTAKDTATGKDVKLERVQ